jgi:spore coat polysaccharide biosynthesis predicted glycosyltransferase SpsG
MRNLLIITELGDGIGFGHYTRCSSIKNYFHHMGVNVLMLLEIKGDFRPADNEKDVNWLSNKAVLIDLAKRFDNVLIDSYLADEAVYLFLKSIFTRVIAIDDYNRIAYATDIILNPNVFGDELLYDTTAEIIAGNKFVILRDTFRRHPAKLTIQPHIKNVLLTFGGTDYRKLCPKVIYALSAYNFNFTVVAGSEIYASMLKTQLGHLCHNILGYISAEEMLYQMMNTDLAISACGQTLHELAYMGVPTIGICIDIDQELNRDKYLKLGFLTAKLDWNDRAFGVAINQALQELLPLEKRRGISNIGIQTVDGRGVENIFRQLFT